MIFKENNKFPMIIRFLFYFFSSDNCNIAPERELFKYEELFFTGGLKKPLIFTTFYTLKHLCFSNIKYSFSAQNCAFL